ncbi:MAG: WXG100 family type VII secretion target [Labedaea sp.]
MNGFQADAGRLSTQAGEFPGLAERAGAIHRELSGTLTELGACWGSDPVGQSFAAVHVDPADATIDRLGTLPGRLGSVGTRFAETGSAYRTQDAAGADTFTGVDSDLA